MPSLQLRNQTLHPELQYESKQFGTSIRFSPEILAHFETYRQQGHIKTEIGGQLFGEFIRNEIRVIRATGPNSADRHGGTWFKPNLGEHNIEIKRLFEQKLHFVGDWHTHPEPEPFPSSWDLESMEDCFRKSHHELKAFLMVIIGRQNFPKGMWVSLHGWDKWERLAFMQSSSPLKNF
jgi:integrative and conjugative element protein (TIGR02256 family)